MRETTSHQVREALQRELRLTQDRRAGERLLLFPGAVRPRSKELQNGGVREWQEGLGHKGRLGERAWRCGRLPPAPASAQDPESFFLSLDLRPGTGSDMPLPEGPLAAAESGSSQVGPASAEVLLKGPALTFLGTHSGPLTSQLSSIRLLCLAATSW